MIYGKQFKVNVSKAHQEAFNKRATSQHKADIKSDSSSNAHIKITMNMTLMLMS